MSCECGYADECDGETAIFYPLQDGGMCAVRGCQKPARIQTENQQTENQQRKNQQRKNHEPTPMGPWQAGLL